MSGAGRSHRGAVRLAHALMVGGLLAGAAGCRKPCDYAPSGPSYVHGYQIASPSNHELVFGVELTDTAGSCDEDSAEFRDVKLEVLDEAGASLPATRIEYSYGGVSPHSTTRLFNIWFSLVVPRGGDYYFRATFPENRWPAVTQTASVPQHHEDAPVVVLPARCSSVGSVGPELWLCDGTLFRGDQQQWAAPTDGGPAISRATEGVAWVHAGNAVYRFEGDGIGNLQTVSLSRSYEALSATREELFLQSPAGVARVSVEGQSLSAVEADFDTALTPNGDYSPERFSVPSLVHGVQVSKETLASVWMYGRGKVRACRWQLPPRGLPPLRTHECADEAFYLTGVGSAGAWLHGGGELAVRDYTTSPPTTRFSRPFVYGEDVSAYETNRRWFYASPRPKPDGSIAFDAWDIPPRGDYQEACRTSRWDAEDDLAWAACGYLRPLYTLVWRREGVAR